MIFIYIIIFPYLCDLMRVYFNLKECLLIYPEYHCEYLAITPI